MNNQHLIITPSVPVWTENNHLIFDRKFYDGILLYQEKWGGKLTCIISISHYKQPDFGVVRLLPEQLPFTCITLHPEELIKAEHLQGGDIVLAAGDADKQLHLSAICKKLSIKCVYIIEYIPETRYQIAALSTNNPIIKLRRLFYIWQQEQRRIKAFKLCDGLQSNGTPAYQYYQRVTNKLLYFDTRVFKEQIIDDIALAQRLTYLSENKPLRLAFSGRLIRMKGADHLIQLALKLKQANIAFQFMIYGTGDLIDEMREFITVHQLTEQVILTGSVDFYTVLIPSLQHSIDLFICLHRQSDPSCTYLETLSCGVPIVGYNNRAFSGLLELADIGWCSELDDIDGICNTIIHLNTHRNEIIEKAKNSAAFARLHDFETTFKNRINHLVATTN